MSSWGALSTSVPAACCQPSPSPEHPWEREPQGTPPHPHLLHHGVGAGLGRVWGLHVPLIDLTLGEGDQRFPTRDYFSFFFCCCCCFIMISGVQTTSGNWLSNLHTPDCQSEPGIPEREPYNITICLLPAVYLHWLIFCLLPKEFMTSESMHISYCSLSENEAK